MSNYIRQPAVAGMFYPADAEELRQMITGFLKQARHEKTEAGSQLPHAIIAPHAGYIYSGPVAASAYASIIPGHDKFTRVILLGPSHRVPLRGLATSSATQFATPLGLIPVDTEANQQLLALPQVEQLDQAHVAEHSLEVHLPFLQMVLDSFTLIPLVVGDASPDEVAEVLAPFWDDENTLIVISSDLSHYHDYQTAMKLDRNTSDAIEKMEVEKIDYGDACGRNPVNGLLTLGKSKQASVVTVDLRNSGDTAGPRDQVVGYGAYIVH